MVKSFIPNKSMIVAEFIFFYYLLSGSSAGYDGCLVS